MSCVLDEIALVKNLPDLLPWLCPHLSENKISDDEVVSGDSWNDEIKKEMNDLSSSDQKILDNSVPWLEECHVAISPFVDIMAIACRNRLAVLTNHWEKDEKGEKKAFLTVNWKGIVGQSNQDEISSIICLPVISQKQSSPGAPDWIGIAVGFRSGYISFYTENGLLLLSQIFEECTIMSLFCRTYIPKNFGSCIYSDLSEELVILYPRSVVSIDGFSLMQTLKACRNQAAKAAASGEECPVAMTSLGYKKWSLAEQEQVHNCVASGMLPPHLYDEVVYQSCSRGFSQSLPSGVPSTTQLITVGHVPFLGILGVREGSVQPFMADIAMHYATKIKDALFSAASGWLFSRRSPDHANRKDKPKIEQATPISFRYTLPDRRRVGLSVKLSLSRRLAAVTDDFGRITVVDVQKCFVIRMFKGYRDAECGWINVEGDWRDKTREVPFLIIYAPRRSILEVWLPQQGPRVAAFNVPKESRLLYTPHTLLGANTQHGGIAHPTPVVLLNQDGTLERISVPFHLALCGKTSKQAKDIHLLKSLKTALRNDSEDQVLKIMKEVQTTSIKLQVLSLIIASKYITVTMAQGIIDIFNPALQPENATADAKDQEMTVQFDLETRLLSQQLSRLSQLLHLYNSIAAFHSTVPLRQPTQEEVETKLGCLLMIQKEDLSALVSDLHDESLHSHKKRQVSFSQQTLALSSFLHGWEIAVGSIDKEALNKEVVPIQISKKITEEREQQLGTFLFGWTYTAAQMEPFCEALAISGVNFTQLLHVAFIYWLHQDVLDEVLMLHMTFIIFTICIYAQPSLESEPSSVNPLLEKVKEELISWCRPLHAFTAALICKGIEAAVLMYGSEIALELQAVEVGTPALFPSLVLNKLYAKLYQSSCRWTCDNESDDFEGLSLELVEWNLLLTRCKKLLPVQRLFTVITRRGGKINLEVSIKILSAKGKGHLSELVAKWLTEANLPAAEIIAALQEPTDKEEGADGAIRESSVHDEDVEMLEHTDVQKDEELSGIKSCLQSIRSNFPESMRSDVLILNLAWEYGAVWKKRQSEIDKLEAAVLSLTSIWNPYLRHGLGTMMWETWIVPHLQTAAQLAEKFRRIPNDRICVRDIGIPEHKLHQFFILSKELLENIITGKMACEIDRPPHITKDDFWSGMESSPSLADVAVGQKMTSSDLAFLHHQLLFVLSLVVQYSLKNIRPFPLFPERDRAAFFKPLFSSWRATSEEAREVVNSLQLAFLNRVISAAVVALPDTISDKDLKTPSGLFDAVELGRTWGLSVDVLRRHYVCELYSSGLDSLADQAVIMIRDGVVMASQMIVIAGQRLQYLITSSKKSMQVISLITPQTKEWCRSLDSGCLRSPDQPIKETMKLIQKAVHLLSESSAEYKIATNLYRAFDMIDNSGLFGDHS